MAESRIRLERQGGFTVLQNAVLRDSRLSLKTKGLFAVLASLPPDWDYSIAGLVAVCGTGRSAISSALAELEAAGYLERQQDHTDRGHFGGMIYVVHDTGTKPEVSELPPEIQDAERATPLSGFPSTVNPSADEPSADEPSAENQQQLNKDLIKERIDKPPIVPQEGDGTELSSPPIKAAKKQRRGEPKERPGWKPERWAGFWDFYSHKVRGESKQAAIRAWDKLKPDDALIDQIGRALLVQISSESWQAGIGKPYASTYLNNQRWLDVLEPGGQSPPAADGGWAEDPEVL